MMASEDHASRRTLSRLLDDLGPGVVGVVEAPGGLDVAITQACIYDRTDPRIGRGEVVLAVGVDPTSSDAEELVARAGTAGAAAVVLKLRAEPPPSLRRATQLAGVALLDATDALAWAHLHTLMRTATAAIGDSLDASGAAAPVGDLFALANAVAAMVGGPTTIEDRNSSVLAYSRHDEPIDEGRRQTILGRRIPDEWMARLHADGVFRRLWDSDEVVRVDYSADGLRPRMVVSVRADHEILGTIWVAEGDVPLGGEAAASLQEAARIAALHLIRHRSSDHLERRRQAELLRGVLEGRTQPGQLLAALDLAGDTAATVMAFDLPGTERSERAVRLDRAVNLIALYCESFQRQAACVVVGSVIYSLMPAGRPRRASAAEESRPGDGHRPADGARAGLVDLATEIVTRLSQALGTPARAAVGSTVDDITDIGVSRREADLVLRVLSRGQRRAVTVGDIDELRSAVVLAELSDLAADRPELRAGKLPALLALDPANKKGYLATLRAYLDTFGDVAAAARKLDIHHNTFRYRLSRLQELSGLDLDDPDERLVIGLQLHFLGTGWRSTATE
jgi:hypothetical protein